MERCRLGLFFQICAFISYSCDRRVAKDGGGGEGRGQENALGARTFELMPSESVSFLVWRFLFLSDILGCVVYPLSRSCGEGVRVLAVASLHQESSTDAMLIF